MTSVAPQRDLAYLALVSSKDEEAERRKSISVEGPKQQIIDLSGSDEPMAMDIDTPNLPAPDDAGSEVTLTSETPVDPLPSHTAEDLPPPYSADGSDFVMVDADVKIPDRDDKENFPPLGAAKNSETLVTEKPLLRTAASEAEDITLPDADDASRPMTPPMPDRPPPIPPRPDAKKRESFSGDLMFGRQQDVTECIGNFMFQLEAAIRPTDHDAHGEQMDLIKE